MSYQSGYNDGWSRAKSAEAIDQILQAQRKRMYASGIDPREALLNFIVLLVIIGATAAAVRGVLELIHGVPFFVAHPLVHMGTYLSAGWFTFAILVRFHKIVRKLVVLAIFGFIASLAIAWLVAVAF